MIFARLDEVGLVDIGVPAGIATQAHVPAVEVERDGQVERLPVLDITRLAQWAMWAVVAIAWVWIGLHALAQGRRERKG